VNVAISSYVAGPLETNTYVVRCGAACVIVDPGMLTHRDLDAIREGGPPEKVLLTHGHGDHIAGIPAVREAFGPIATLCPAADAAMLSDAAFNLSAPFGLPIVAPPPDELIEPGEVIEIGPSQWEVLDTSGHTPGGVSFYCAAAGVVIVGDALFAGSIGRCDIPGASEQRLLRNIREKLLSLPEETRVLPGHREETTIGREKRTNPYLSP
jgi:glyoxylase-like metal-dependent hydrolase (beta-lactamase superfamily II)